MKMLSKKEICEMAIRLYGKEAQVLMMLEEMSELQKELCKNMRGRDNTNSIAEEIADVEIMLEQMKIYFDLQEDVNVWSNVKLKRLQDKLLNREKG